MAIEHITVGDSPESGNGETLYSAFTKINDNFSDAENAASKLIQTSPTDTTAGRVLTTDTDIVVVGGLGTAATANVVTSATDVTAGRLLKVGATVDQLDTTNSNIEFVPDVAPTLYFDFVTETYNIYDGFGVGFIQKPLADIVTHARTSNGSGVDPIGRVGTVGSNVPRLVFDQGVGKGYLSEEQRTNLLTNSEFPNGLSDATGNSTGISLASLDYGEGIVNSIFFDSGASRAAYKTNFTPTIGVAYTFSCIVEMSDGLSPSFSTTVIDNDFLIYMNSSPVSVTSYKIEKLYGKTYRVFCTSVSANTSISYGVVKLVSNSPRTFKVTGYQLEEGSFPTSYIKTLGSAVTRTADSMTRTLSNEWNPNEGTLVFSYTDFFSTASAEIITISEGFSVSERVFIYAPSGSNYLRLGVYTAGVNFLSPDVTIPKDSKTIAISLSSNNTIVSWDGDVATYLTNKPPALDNVKIARAANNGNIATIKIKRLTYYPKAFDAATLQKLSRIN